MGHRNIVRLGSLTAAVLSLFISSAHADEVKYRQVNLVSDLPGVAVLQDTNLVNAWGISFGAPTPFWVSDNGTGLATLYSVTNDPTGMTHVDKQSLQVTIPGNGTPTGQVFNNVGGFHGDLFLFVSEDGTVSGWRGALGTTAETLVPGSPTNVYKGVTLVKTINGPMLLAANFRQGTVDAFDTNAALVGRFKDMKAPAGFAPFGIQAISNLVFVTFAMQDADKHDDVAGRGNGLIDILDPATGTFHRFATGSSAGGKVKDMNSPWGIALAPKSFVRSDAQLLVGNFGSGTIMTFDSSGNFQGNLQAEHGPALSIDGLWGLTFGNGTKAGDPQKLYFSAGPAGESHGLFGSLEPVKHGHDGGNDHGDDDDQD